jgi:glucosamine-6-phosphate deaminase
MSVRKFSADQLAVEIHRDRQSLGRAAAQGVAQHLHQLLQRQQDARVIFACAPSQDEFLMELIQASQQAPTSFDWQRLTVFHMDDYVGFTAQHPQSFRAYLHSHLLQHVKVGKFCPLEAELPPILACERYTARLAEAPIDLICLGIGENGHLAFNDPPVADFHDPVLVKAVPLEPACRKQQVHDGCFARLEEVPLQALTLTLPVFSQARKLSVQVPGPRKAKAVRATIRDPQSTQCPATLLRSHPNAVLHLDQDSASLL